MGNGDLAVVRGLLVPRGTFLAETWIERSGHRHVTGRALAHNVVCANGLYDLAQAVGWAGVQDIGADIGASPAYLTPLFGAVGVGSNPMGSDTGSTTINSLTVTGVAAPSWVLTGMAIQGNGIQANTVITAIGSGTYTMSNVATVTAGPVALTIGGSPSDSTLYSEIARAQATDVAAQPSSGYGASTQWLFQFGAQSQAYTLTEAGVFCVATVNVNTGDLLDHAAFVGGFSWPAGQSLTLTVNLNLWYQ